MGYSSRNISALQRSLAPKVYGSLDLDITPERFRTELGPNSIVRNNKRIQALLDNPEQVEFFRQLTLMGDPLADAFAALIPKLGFPKARVMLDQAASQGIASVPDAPQELIDLMASMENEPAWVDWNLIDRATEDARLIGAFAGDAVMRAAFMMTYVNGYQGLPMVITGALTGESAAKRMQETTSTFKLATLPGALRKGGVAYQSAAKVRVMHAMVRTNLLKRPQQWDYSVYGTPIPQVDQMGAALGFNYMMSMHALKHGGVFNKSMRAAVEQARYLAHLLGMHDQFLSADPKQIVETWQMCQATLRHKFDPRGKDLNRATINAWRRPGHSALDKVLHNLDVQATRFMYTKMVGKRTAEEMGIHSTPTDALSFLAEFGPIGFSFGAMSLLKKIPGGRQWVDKFAIDQVQKQLRTYGEAEYKTDANHYKSEAV